jgi:hypothetical protein
VTRNPPRPQCGQSLRAVTTGWRTASAGDADGPRSTLIAALLRVSRPILNGIRSACTSIRGCGAVGLNLRHSLADSVQKLCGLKPGAYGFHSRELQFGRGAGPCYFRRGTILMGS